MDLVSVRWERIQVIVRLRPRPGEPLNPLGVELRRRGTAGRAVPHDAMRPTRSFVEGSEIVARFNVMLGPGQRPLEPGRWILVWANAGHRADDSIHVDDPDSVAAAAPAARFELRQGEYRAAVRLDPADRSLGLDITQGTVPPRISWRAVRHSVRRARSLLFWTLIAALQLAADRNGRRVLFTSVSRAEIGGNLKLVHDRMVERGLDRTYELLTLFKPDPRASRSWRDLVRLPWLLAQADVVVIDDYHPVIYGLDGSRVKIIQLWHASGAFKAVDYSRIGKEGAPSPYARIHKNYRYAVVSSDHDVPFYAEAFGIPEERVVPTGIPRMDRFFDPKAQAEGREAALDAFPEARGRKTILFAPTFRGSGRKNITYDFSQIDYAALHALCVEQDAVVIVRPHPSLNGRFMIPAPYRDRILDQAVFTTDAPDVLFAADLLVTDYSSIVFEYSTLDRPMLFFAYDLEEYIATRDFYVPYEEFVPGKIVRTFDALLDAIRREDYEAEKVRPFVDRHFGHRDSGSTDRVIDRLILG